MLRLAKVCGSIKSRKLSKAGLSTILNGVGGQHNELLWEEGEPEPEFMWGY